MFKLNYIILPILLFTNQLLAEVSSSTAITNSRNAASELSSTINSTYISNFSNTISAPATSGSQVTTTDGSKSGTVNLTCSENKVLLARISLVGSNNITINVKIDADLNGSFEKDLNFSNISGIHTLGVFSCASGASSCSYYNWIYSSGSLELGSILQSNANAPYCINDACGSLYSRNPSQILNDVSGTITALIQASTSLVVTKVVSSSSVADIYAQKYDNCSNSNSGETIYTASSGIPSEATIQSQASNASFTSSTNTVISSVSTNQSTNVTSASDLTDIKAVTSVATSTATVDSSDARTINYSATVKDTNGNYSTTSSSSSMNFEHISPEYCMVEWQEVYTSVSSDGNVRGVTASGLRTTKKSETRLCTGAYNNICPVVDGETIKYDCGNLGKSLNQAAGALNVLKGVVDDMICNVTQ